MIPISFDRNDERPDWFQNVPDCSIVSIENNRKILGQVGPGLKAAVPLGPIFSPIVHNRDKFSNREQSETNRNDENAMCDYLSEYLRMCFRLYEGSSRPFLTINGHFANES